MAKTGVYAQSELSSVVGPLFDDVADRIGHIPGALETPIATYEMVDGGLAIVVGYAYDGEAPEGTEVVELPEQLAVCTEHHGHLSGIGDSWMALHEWIGAAGHEFDGACREHYVVAEMEDQSDWIVELQQPIRQPAS